MSSPPLYPLNIKTNRRQREQNLCARCPRSPPRQSWTEAHKPSVCDVALGSGSCLETTTSSSSDHSSAAGSGRQHQSINLCLPEWPLHKQGLTGPGNERVCPEIYRKLQLPALCTTNSELSGSNDASGDVVTQRWGTMKKNVVQDWGLVEMTQCYHLRSHVPQQLSRSKPWS